MIPVAVVASAKGCILVSSELPTFQSWLKLQFVAVGLSVSKFTCMLERSAGERRRNNRMQQEIVNASRGCKRTIISDAPQTVVRHYRMTFSGHAVCTTSRAQISRQAGLSFQNQGNRTAPSLGRVQDSYLSNTMKWIE
jgi:hypothetical protein